MNRFTVFVLIVLVLALPKNLAADSSPIKIGVIASLDPVVASYSTSANICFEKARQEINESGGIAGRKLELIFEDDRFLPKNALAAYHKLRNVDRVDFIIGPQFDHTMSAVRHIATKDKHLLIQTIGTTPVNDENYGYIIHSYPSDKRVGEALAKRITRDGRRKLAFLIPQESYSLNLANYVKAALKDVQFEWIEYEPNISDYNQILLKAKSYQPDALVFFFLMPDAAATAYKKMRELGINLPVYTNEQIHAQEQFLSGAGAIADPTYYYLVDFNEKDPAIEDLLRALNERPALPAYCIAAYDTLRWLAMLIRKHGTDNDAIRKAIYLMEFKGLLTTYRFDKKGDLSDSRWAAWKITKDGFVRDSAIE